MEIDIKGKINEKKLAYSNTLLPLYEAIVNSIQAIEEDSATSPGIIEIDYRKNTPIYAYIVCDLPKKLKAFTSDAGYKKLPSGDGYFSFNDNYNMYVEILSFDKILKDSKERNRVLFEKLNLT